jgi:tRNA threonylcarbamoyladenosine biosynthesis protein TsaB
VTGSGPGTFTGVRIAVATARALALALNVPVIGVSTLGALAAEAAGSAAVGAAGAAASGAASETEVIVPVVDARRGQVFYAIYRRAEGGFARTEALGVVDRDALFSVIPARPGTLVVGDIAALGEGAAAAGGGAELRAMEIRAEYLVAGQGLLREPGDGVEGARLGTWLAAAAEAGSYREWKPGEPGSPESVKPIYVRTPDADIHITKMRDPWADAGGSSGR